MTDPARAPGPGPRVRRVYLPVAATGVRQLLATGVCRPRDELGYAVTGLVRAAFPGQDEEELEYEALCVAAAVCSQWWPGHRQIVLAADLPSSKLRDALADTDTLPDPDPRSVVAGHDGQGVPTGSHEAYAVRVSGSLQAGQVQAVHVQEDVNDPEAELLWYDVSELAQLLDDLTD